MREHPTTVSVNHRRKARAFRPAGPRPSELRAPVGDGPRGHRSTVQREHGRTSTAIGPRSVAPARRVARPSTFSVVAADLDRGEWGVAVQSKFIAVGSVVPWAEAKVGAIATQALANVAYGPEGLGLLRQGLSAPEVVRKLTSADPERDHRQLGIVDARGQAASFTGSKCMTWAGHVVGEGFCCQGNILLSPDVVSAMAKAMEATPGDLADRMLSALAAGQKMGGDRRGQQSAALFVAKPKGSYGGLLDRYIDVRVDDHPAPIEELKRVFALYDMTMLEREDPATLVPLGHDVVVEVQKDLRQMGYYFGTLSGTWDRPTREAFSKYLGVENFENKERKDGKVWPSVLGHLRRQARSAQEEAGHAQRPVYGALEAGPGRTVPGTTSAAPSGRSDPGPGAGDASRRPRGRKRAS